MAVRAGIDKERSDDEPPGPPGGNPHLNDTPDGHDRPPRNGRKAHSRKTRDGRNRKGFAPDGGGRAGGDSRPEGEEKLVVRAGIGPATHCLEGSCSIH